MREYLDQQLDGLKGAVSRLANKLQRRLQAKQNRTWKFDLEEGLLDAAKLSRVVLNPTTPLSFKQESSTNFKDTIVSLLIDNSGSMRVMLNVKSWDLLLRHGKEDNREKNGWHKGDQRIQADLMT